MCMVRVSNLFAFSASQVFLTGVEREIVHQFECGEDALYLANGSLVRVYVVEVDGNRRRIIYMNDNGFLPYVPVEALQHVDTDILHLFEPLTPFQTRKYKWTPPEPTLDERQRNIYYFSAMMNKGAILPLYDRHSISPSWIRNVQARLVEFYLFRRARSIENYNGCKIAGTRYTSLLGIIQSFHDACQYFVKTTPPPSVEGIVSMAMVLLPYEYFVDPNPAFLSGNEGGLEDAYRTCHQHAMKLPHDSDDIIDLGTAIENLEKFPIPRTLGGAVPRNLVKFLKVKFLPQVKFLKEFKELHMTRFTNLHYMDTFTRYVEHMNTQGKMRQSVRCD